MKDPKYFSFQQKVINGTAALSNKEQDTSNLWNVIKSVFIQLLWGNGL